MRAVCKAMRESTETASSRYLAITKKLVGWPTFQPTDPAIIAMPGEPPADATPPAGDAVPGAAPSGGGATVVQAALSRVGSPYSWGAAGPNAFDCSGLIMWAFQQNGKSLPHSSRALAAGGQPVSTSELQPGDIVTFYSDASHAGIYIGEGVMVHASTYGTPVRVAPISSSPSTTPDATNRAQSHQMLALPAFHCSHGMFQSPRPSVPGSVEPTVLITSTMSPRLVLS